MKEFLLVTAILFLVAGAQATEVSRVIEIIGYKQIKIDEDTRFLLLQANSEFKEMYLNCTVSHVQQAGSIVVIAGESPGDLSPFSIDSSIVHENGSASSCEAVKTLFIEELSKGARAEITLDILTKQVLSIKIKRVSEK